MKLTLFHKTIRHLAVAAAAVVSLASATAHAQRSSLFHDDLPSDGRVLRLPGTSWTYRALEPPKEIRLNDIVTVLVDEKSTVTSKGKFDSKKNGKLDMQLKDFIKLDGTSLKPAAQANGDPRINASIDGQYKADAELSTADGMKFRIGVTVLDIRPNGTLVLEGHRTIQFDDEIWELSLTGTIRREDVLPNNTVMSENIADMKIEKRSRGHVRDTYRRRWMYKLWDTVAPF